MSEHDISHLVLQSNTFKVGGYKEVGLDFLESLLEAFYPDNIYGDVILSRYLKLANGGKVSFQDLCGKLFFTGKRVASSENNTLVRLIYSKALINPVYEEFAFVLFILGIVNSKDYIANCGKIGYIMSKITTEKVGGRASTVSQLRFKRGQYFELLYIYLELSLEGKDFGFSPFDFVYHMRGLYDRPSELVTKLEAKNAYELKFSKSILNNAIIGKYADEVGILLIFVSSKVPVEVSRKVLSCCSVEVLAELMSSPSFIMESGMAGIQYRENA